MLANAIHINPQAILVNIIEKSMANDEHSFQMFSDFCKDTLWEFIA